MEGKGEKSAQLDAECAHVRTCVFSISHEALRGFVRVLKGIALESQAEGAIQVPSLPGCAAAHRLLHLSGPLCLPLWLEVGARVPISSGGHEGVHDR